MLCTEAAPRRSSRIAANPQRSLASWPAYQVTIIAERPGDDIIPHPYHDPGKLWAAAKHCAGVIGLSAGAPVPYTAGNYEEVPQCIAEAEKSTARAYPDAAIWVAEASIVFLTFKKKGGVAECTRGYVQKRVWIPLLRTSDGTRYAFPG
jgi:hypothetical protein